ncbi:MAG: SDR family oxidoreductase [Chloroflexi bacterium]|nr:SDR family oxidoreductase [Chloroflexota bacterium]
MDLGLKDRVAIVTGGSRGLGRQAALALGKEGCKLAICARNAEGLSRAVAEMEALGNRVMGVSADVTSAQDCRRFYEATITKYGHVDILVNNAGGNVGPREFEKMTDEDFLGQLNLNLMSAIRMIRLVLQGMKERRWGRIINVASIWGRESGGSASYMTSKAALIALGKRLSGEFAPDNILVNTIAPGSILFPGGGWERFTKNNPPEVVQDFVKEQFPMGKFGWPEPIGEMIAFLASDRADLVTGTCVNIDGGQSHSLI